MRTEAKQTNCRRLLSSRLFKEVRLLALPGAVAAATVCLFFVLSALEGGHEQTFLSMLSLPTVITFFGCLLLIAASPFGKEFQHRTLPLLLSQPYPRFSIWGEKLIASAIVLLMLGVLVLATQFVLLQNKGFAGLISLAFGASVPNEWGEVEVGKFLYGGLLFAFTALCSAPLWTLTTKSTIGGVAFTGVGQFVAFLITEYLCQKLYIHEGVGTGLGALIYSSLCLWLGWRTFALLEIREGATAIPQDLLEPTNPEQARGWHKRLIQNWVALGTGGTWLDRSLRCRPTGSLGNLIRKELRLQKPVYLLGVLFTVCWLVVLGLQLLQPHQGYENLFPAISALHVPLVLLLAGSISLSDENSLGLTGWQLTLPVSAVKQWWVKLAVSLIAGAAVGWLLPVGLVAVSSVTVVGTTSSSWLIGEAGLVLLCISGLLFVLSFWAVALVGNSIRAVLLSLVAIVVLPFGIGAGLSTADALTGLPSAGSDSFVLPAVLLIVVALGQSLRLFRRPAMQQSALIVYPGTLLIAAFVLGFFERCL